MRVLLRSTSIILCSAWLTRKSAVRCWVSFSCPYTWTLFLKATVWLICNKSIQSYRKSIQSYLYKVNRVTSVQPSELNGDNQSKGRRETTRYICVRKLYDRCSPIILCLMMAKPWVTSERHVFCVGVLPGRLIAERTNENDVSIDVLVWREHLGKMTRSYAVPGDINKTQMHKYLMCKSHELQNTEQT